MNLVSLGFPSRAGFPDGCGEGVRAGQRELTMAIVKEDSNRLVQPCGADNKVGRVVTIHIAGSDLKPSEGCSHSDGLSAAGREMERNRVARVEAVESFEIDRSQVRLPVTIEVGDGEIGIRRNRGNR